LIKDDVYGVDNIAFATSKKENKWSVALIYYETLESKKCPPDYFTKRDVGFQACLNKYNFYQRRWHDYDFTKGVARKTGDGESDVCTKWIEDLPGKQNECQKKKPLNPPPITPKAEKEDKKVDKPKKPVPKKPEVKQPHTTPKPGPTPPPKKPEPPKREKKDPTKTPEEIRRQNDQDFMNKMKARRDIHQVISLKKVYQWLDQPNQVA